MAERAILRLESRRAPVTRNRMDKRVALLLSVEPLSFGDLFPEIVGVCLRSVVTVEFGGDHGGEKLSLNPAQA
jgi:hypothetical protein